MKTKEKNKSKKKSGSKSFAKDKQLEQVKRQYDQMMKVWMSSK